MGGPDRRDLRIGDAERQSAADALGEHFGQGRLNPDEYGERSAAAYAARTAGELDELFLDLPALHPPPPRLQPTLAVPPHLGYPHPGHPHLVRAPFAGPDAPYGRHPVTGAAYSDRMQVVAGLLQLFLPFGIGRLYSGHIGIGVAQLVLAIFGIGMIWSFIDGIVILAGRPTDGFGRPLR